MSEDKKNGKQNKTVKPFDPMTLRGVTVRNRIWLPPMDTYSALAQDGKPTPFHYQHYVSRAMGGFGMIIMEATAVAPIKAPVGKGKFDVLEVTGYIYKAEYRMHFIYAQIPDSCVLMGQEIIELSDPY